MLDEQRRGCNDMMGMVCSSLSKGFLQWTQCWKLKGASFVTASRSIGVCEQKKGLFCFVLKNKTYHEETYV